MTLMSIHTSPRYPHAHGMKDEVRTHRELITRRINVAFERLQQRLGKDVATQGELARRLGVRPETVNRYLSGVMVPSVEAIPALADALGVSIDDLLRGVDPRASELHPLLRDWLATRAPKDLPASHRAALADLDPPANADHTFYPNMYAAVLHGLDTYEFQRQLHAKLDEVEAATAPKSPKPEGPKKAAPRKAPKRKH